MPRGGGQEWYFGGSKQSEQGFRLGLECRDTRMGKGGEEPFRIKIEKVCGSGFATLFEIQVSRQNDVLRHGSAMYSDVETSRGHNMRGRQKSGIV